jgi:hypothetical protein
MSENKLGSIPVASILMLTGAAGVGVVGLLSAGLNSISATAGCAPDGVAFEAAGTTSMVAFGAALGIAIHALSNTFNLMAKPETMGLVLLLITVVILILGSIIISLRIATDDTEEIKKAKTQKMMNVGGMMIGCALGIFIPSIMGLLLSGRKSNDDKSPKKESNVKKQSTAIGGALLGLLATVVGSWSWNGYNKCRADPTNTGTDMSLTEGLNVVNAIFTVISGLYFVYCVAYVIKCRGGSCHYIPLPDMLKKKFTKSAATPVPAGGGG